MLYQRKVSITQIAKKYGFIVCNRQFKNDEISCIICENIIDDKHEKAIYINRNLASRTKRFLVALALSYYDNYLHNHIKINNYYKKIYSDDNPNKKIMDYALELILPTERMLDIIKQEENIYSKIFLLSNSFEVEPQIIYYKLKLLEEKYLRGDKWN